MKQLQQGSIKGQILAVIGLIIFPVILFFIGKSIIKPKEPVSTVNETANLTPELIPTVFEEPTPTEVPPEIMVQAINTPTPIPPKATLVPSKTPTSTPTPKPQSSATPKPPTPTSQPVGGNLSTPTTVSQTCSKKSLGDANCDGYINNVDKNIWLASYLAYLDGQAINLAADFNNDSKTDLVDYSIWRANYGK